MSARPFRQAGWPALAVAFVGCSPLAWAGPSIDLDAPGALDALARARPEHHARVLSLLHAAEHRPPASVARFLATDLCARDVDASALLKTSYPARRRLAFSLDEARYELLLAERRSPWSFVR